MTEYVVVERLPTEAEHRALSASVGWQGHIDDSVLGDSLAGSLTGVVVEHEGAVVGMARLVGDGVHYFYVQDVVVHPDHEGQGLASRLTARLVDWVDATATAPAFIGLFASSEAEGVYDALGFETSGMTGMHRGV